MKHTTITLITLVFALMATPAVSAKPKKPTPEVPAAGSPVAAVLKVYDTDKNGRINVDESITLQSAYRANKEDPQLKPIDTNKDGELSDQEIMKFFPEKTAAAKKKPAAQKKKPKK